MVVLLRMAKCGRGKSLPWQTDFSQWPQICHDKYLPQTLATHTTKNKIVKSSIDNPARRGRVGSSPDTLAVL